MGVDFRPCRQTGGLSASMADNWSWGPTMMVRSWVRLWGWEVASDHDVEKLGPTTLFRNWDRRSWCTERWNVISIVWLRKTFKNCLSPRVEEPNSEVNNKTFVAEAKESACILFAFVFCICKCVCMTALIEMIIVGIQHLLLQLNMQKPIPYRYVGIYNCFNCSELVKVLLTK